MLGLVLAGGVISDRFVPMIAIRRFRLYARTCKLISVRTRGNVRVRKCVCPIQDWNFNGTTAQPIVRLNASFLLQSTRCLLELVG